MSEWDPREVGDDQTRTYDALRERCPVAYSETQGWSLLRHADVLAALHDPVTFSSRVSTHVAVPNGMDGAEHAAFRAVVDRCFTPQRVAEFAPDLRRIAESLVVDLSAAGQPVEVMTALGHEAYVSADEYMEFAAPEAIDRFYTQRTRFVYELLGSPETPPLSAL